MVFSRFVEAITAWLSNGVVSGQSTCPISASQKPHASSIPLPFSFPMKLSLPFTWNSLGFWHGKPPYTNHKVLSQPRIWNSVLQLGQHQPGQHLYVVMWWLQFVWFWGLVAHSNMQEVCFLYYINFVKWGKKPNSRLWYFEDKSSLKIWNMQNLIVSFLHYSIVLLLHGFCYCVVWVSCTSEHFPWLLLHYYCVRLHIYTKNKQGDALWP